MRFFFADSQDVVDPRFDFEREKHPIDRIRQRDDVYAHELFTERAYDGVLVSKGIVDGVGQGNGRYTTAQRHRLFRVGVHEFFRTRPTGPDALPIMGDCGAFTYVREKEPPYTVEEVLYFYAECRFDYGISIDHVILEYKPAWDEGTAAPAAEAARERQELTLELAEAFLKEHRAQGLAFEPIGVAQGWSPKSYAAAVEGLQKIGYSYIALGGMVPLKTQEILDTLGSVRESRRSETRLHLLGVTRFQHVREFADAGVVSIDSTSPLRQAFKDDKDNYYADGQNYTAIRVPQIEGNARLQKKIGAGNVGQDHARKLERECLSALKDFDQGKRDDVDEVVDLLCEYERLLNPKANHREIYREVLLKAPWKDCPCDVCRDIGYQVLMFRGAERNRRRGFHNLWVFYRRLRRQLGLELVCESTTS